jgi:hypothetical protein
MSQPDLSELAEATLRVLSEQGEGGKPLTLQQASNLSGVSATMIQYMTKGRAVGCEGVIRFAQAFGEDVPTWLDMAGHNDIADIWRGGASKHQLRTVSEWEQLLEAVPKPRRERAREAAKQAIKTLIVPLYAEAA